ncbi:LysR substrate-binding domain-containing protein [Variovorax rhizosphaerae]|uniref:LysR substrate-binding domain-containing protein n=1 Tax=Variovorax rhizosphaerae TaxID=1836200 RepID=A0ABU8WSL4_9BURK
MDLKLLQLLVDLVEAGSLSKVCAARGIAQSALSKQIAGLERDFDAKLFYRTGRGLALTEFGQAIMPRVHSILSEAEALRDEIRAHAGVPRGPVRLAMQTSITQFVVGALFQRVLRDYPQVELRLMEGFSGSIEEWLANGKADVGVLARYGGVHSARTDEALNTADLYLVGAAGDTLTAQPDISFAALANLPLVLPGIPDGLRLMLAETARRFDIPIHAAVEVDSLTAMKEIVAGGSGYTILTRQAVHFELAQKRLQVARIVEPTLTRTLVLSTSVHRPMTLASRAVASLIREIGGGLSQDSS